MTAIACIILIVCVLILMVSLALGPFANEPFYRFHQRFKQLNQTLQHIVCALATLLSILCSLLIIGVFA